MINRIVSDYIELHNGYNKTALAVLRVKAASILTIATTWIAYFAIMQNI